jgi:putative endonuclease
MADLAGRCCRCAQGAIQSAAQGGRIKSLTVAQAKPAKRIGKGVTPTIWQVYVLECVNGSLYTGISTDSTRRYQQHVDGKGARYTRSYPPRRIMAIIAMGSRSSALKAEFAIKQLPAPAKRKLCRRIAKGEVVAANLDAVLLALLA